MCSNCTLNVFKVKLFLTNIDIYKYCDSLSKYFYLDSQEKLNAVKREYNPVKTTTSTPKEIMEEDVDDVKPEKTDSNANCTKDISLFKKKDNDSKDKAALVNGVDNKLTNGHVELSEKLASKTTEIKVVDGWAISCVNCMTWMA